MSTLSQFFGGGSSNSIIKSIQRGEATLASGTGASAKSNTITISSVDSNKSILTFTSRYGVALDNPDQGNHNITGVFLSNTSIKFQRGGAYLAANGELVDIEWQVIEFN